MNKTAKTDWYWPLGSLGYADEIRDQFPIEAELLGVMTILWSRQELALQRVFEGLVASRNGDYVSAIWDRQPTHQAKRDLLALALTTVKLTKRQTAVLAQIIEKTKTIADRRNELIHAAYVVHGENYKLHARVKPPRSNKPPKYQKATEADLKCFLSEMQQLVRITEWAWRLFMSSKMKKFARSIERSSTKTLLTLQMERDGSDPQIDHVYPTENGLPTS